MSRREQLPLVLLAVAGVAVAAGLGVLVWKVSRDAPPIGAAGPAIAPVPRAPSDEPEEPAAAAAEPPSIPGIPRATARAGFLAGAEVAQPRAEQAVAMQEAVAAYDRADYEGAASRALTVLAREPDNVRMLRVVVSSSCILGDTERAKQYYPRLPSSDQREIARRCSRYGVEF